MLLEKLAVQAMKTCRTLGGRTIRTPRQATVTKGGVGLRPGRLFLIATELIAAKEPPEIAVRSALDKFKITTTYGNETIGMVRIYEIEQGESVALVRTAGLNDTE